MTQYLPRNIYDKLLIVAIIILIAIFVVDEKKELTKTPEVVSILTPQSTSSPFFNLPIDAKAAYVYDIKNNQVFYEKDAHEALPLASITKIMTGLVALQSFATDTKITFTESDNTGQDGDRIKVGETWDLKKLLDFTLVASSNDGAEALASSVGSVDTFTQAMNTEAWKLKLNSMHFDNPSGLDTSTTTAGAYGSAADVAHLFAYVLSTYPEMFDATTKPNISVASNLYMHNVDNTNVISSEIPGLLGSKTGLTDLAGGNLAVVINAGIERPIVLVTLGGNTESRFSDILTLVHATYAYLALEK